MCSKDYYICGSNTFLNFQHSSKMSCCPSVKCRNTGSGYVKSSASGSSSESNKKLDEMMAARAVQDSTYFPPLHTSAPQIPTAPVNHIQLSTKK